MNHETIPVMRYYCSKLTPLPEMVYSFLRLFTGKTHLQIKLKHLRKVWICIFGQLVYYKLNV